MPGGMDSGAALHFARNDGFFKDFGMNGNLKSIDFALFYYSVHIVEEIGGNRDVFLLFRGVFEVFNV